MFAAIVVLVVALVAVVFDVRTRRIPNWLTFGAALAALVYAGVRRRVCRRRHGCSRLAGRRGALLSVFRARRHGRRRREAARRARRWLGPAESVWLAMFAATAGGVLGLVVALCPGYLRTAFIEPVADADALAHRASSRCPAHAEGHELPPARLRDSDHDRSVVHVMATLTTGLARRGERGQAIIELALTLPLLLLVAARHLRLRADVPALRGRDQRRARGRARRGASGLHDRPGRRHTRRTTSRPGGSLIAARTVTICVTSDHRSRFRRRRRRPST